MTTTTEDVVPTDDAIENSSGAEGQEAAEAAAEVAYETAPEKKDRAASLLATRKAKMDALFAGKKYRIAKEIHLSDEERFETPFGNKGRHGFALVLAEGYEPTEGQPEKFIVGATMLEQIAKDYSAVDLPVKERKRRTKEQKAADDARAAEERAQRLREQAERIGVE